MQDSREKEKGAHPPMGMLLLVEPSYWGKSEGSGEAPMILARLSPASVFSPLSGVLL